MNIYIIYIYIYNLINGVNKFDKLKRHSLKNFVYKSYI